MSVVEVYREFTHQEPTRVTTIRLPRGAEGPAQVAQIAIAVAVGGLTPRYRLTLSFYGWRRNVEARLLATENERLLVYTPAGGLAKISEVEYVEYLSDKDGETAIYRHDFKEPRPALVVVPNTKGKLARFVGGAYTIEEHGIVG